MRRTTNTKYNTNNHNTKLDRVVTTIRKGQLMNRYELTARKGRYLRTLRFADINDIEATYSATFRVLNKAKRYKGTWARGQIVLRNVSTNTIIAQMVEK